MSATCTQGNAAHNLPVPLLYFVHSSGIDRTAAAVVTVGST